MRRFIRENRSSPSFVISMMALIVGLAGTAIAAPVAIQSVLNKPEKKQVKKIATNKINELAPTLSVSKAATADDSTRLGGQPLSAFRRTDLCQTGNVLGFARIRGDDGAIPATFSASATHIDTTYNCSGGTVVVRRTGTGSYLVRFNGNPAVIAQAQVRYETDVGDDKDNCATLFPVGGGGDIGAFQVDTFDCGTNAAEDTDFTLILP